ncbi:hypothetical protein BJ165DRAFT_1440906 [Panaeolus papilionaceus]|nr:hypothetical protein BJ165DRAFT_1440906 [Panaeolus papilionaceus]
MDSDNESSENMSMHSALTKVSKTGKRRRKHRSKPKPYARPFLPQRFLDEMLQHPMNEGFISAAFDQQALKARLKRNHHLFQLAASTHHTHSTDDDRHNIIMMIIGDEIDPEDNPGTARNLHAMAVRGDVIMLAEMIYCGANIDKLDRHGLTPVVCALFEKARLNIPDIRSKWGFPPDPFAVDLTTMDEVALSKHAQRIDKVIDVLLDTWANLNVDIPQHTPEILCSLHLSVYMADIDLLWKLLRHEAIPHGITSEFMRAHMTTEFQYQLASLFKNNPGVIGTRPDRACPCFSGLTADECHGKESPDISRIEYPDEYLCLCPSKRGVPYGECCKKTLSHIIYETYVGGKIVPHFAMSDRMDADTRQKIKDYLAVMSNQDLVSTVARYHLALDPAFWYAIQTGLYPPLPATRESMRSYVRSHQDEWNRAIDEYIGTGRDPRPRTTIETHAKVGHWNGVYLRDCENCKKREYKFGEFKICERCKIAPYCSRLCQTAHWKHHRGDCDDYLPKASFSQMIIREVIRAMMQEGRLTGTIPAKSNGASTHQPRAESSISRTTSTSSQRGTP